MAIFISKYIYLRTVDAVVKFATYCFLTDGTRTTVGNSLPLIVACRNSSNYYIIRILKTYIYILSTPPELLGIKH